MSPRGSALEEVKATWEDFKAIETRDEADIERQLLMLTDDVVMENPMLRAEGQDAARDFLLEDIHWNTPIYQWECFAPDRVAISWAQHPLCSKQSEPMMLRSRATWKYAGHGKFSHYYAAWCRVDAFRVMRDAGMSVKAEDFLGPELKESSMKG